MLTSNSTANVLALKDGASQQPIPTLWRPVFAAIVAAFANGDYPLKNRIPGVEAPSPETSAAISQSIADYGAELAALSEETWSSSACMWYGSYWDALVDLWTLEEGPSDLVLSCRVAERAHEFSFVVSGVYVP